MFEMNVKLLSSTPLINAETAIRKCYDNKDKSDSNFEEGIIGDKGFELIKRIGVKMKHASTLEHIVYTFDIDGISRACLQELARHRIASYTVRSTRYTLRKHLANEEYFEYRYSDLSRVSKYAVLTNDPKTDKSIIESLNNLIDIFKCEDKSEGSNKSADVAKYALPEALKTSLVMTINARSLRNFLTLRTGKTALSEIRKLAFSLYYALPTKDKELFSDVIPFDIKAIKYLTDKVTEKYSDFKDSIVSIVPYHNEDALISEIYFNGDKINGYTEEDFNNYCIEIFNEFKDKIVGKEISSTSTIVFLDVKNKSLSSLFGVENMNAYQDIKNFLK